MNSAAFKQSIAETTMSLKPLAYKLTRDSEQSDDLIQETVVKAISNSEKFTQGTNLKAWLYTIMKNTFITNYQRVVRRKTSTDGSENQFFLNSYSPDVENGAIDAFKREDIEKALSMIEDNYKVPFMLYFKGFKYHEIAEKLNVPIGTVKNRIHLCRKQLKEMLSMYNRKKTNTRYMAAIRKQQRAS